MARSLLYYHNFIFWINFSVYWLYFLFKYVVALILWVLLEIADKDKEPRCYDIGGGTCSDCFQRIAKVVLCLVRKPVLYIFGKELAMKKTHSEEENAATLSLNKRRLSYGSTAVFFIILVSFVLISLGSALDLSLFSVTHICSEDPKIECYPQLIQGANKTGLNISTTEPIKDCTFWNSDGVSKRVTFVCYQFVYNIDVFFATLGGFLAFAVLITKTVAQMLVFMGKCCQVCESEGCKKVGYLCRVILAIAALLVEVGLAIVALVYGAAGSTVDDVDDTPIEMFLVRHAAEILIACGATATLLWIPWEYLSKEETEQKDYELKPRV